MKAQIEEILAPIKIGKVIIPNRIVMPAMVTNLSNDHGMVTDRMVNYYEERARHGVGLIIIEACSITPEGKSTQRQPSIFDDKFIEGLSRLVHTLHKYEVKVGIQLAHPGRYAVGSELISASDIPSFRTKAIPKVMSLKDIERITEAFASGALRAKQAGFDLIEFHFAHGYLVPQFWSSLTNKRADKYGGSFENRIRISQEIIENTRKLTRGGISIICRISGREFVRGGLEIDETKLIAGYLEKCGIDAIHVSGGIVDCGFFTVPRMAIPKGVFVQDAAEIKKVVKIPVIVAGKITDLFYCANIVRRGKADLVSIGRALIADPAIIQKTLERRYDDIRPCIGCCYCHERIKSREPIGCAINAEVGGEREYNKGFRKKAKTVLVVGGGPAGLEAARIASLKGNKVILYEKEGELGGQLRFAWIPPYKGILKNFLKFLVHQVRNSSVEIILKKKLTYREVKAKQPNIIILATGGGSVKTFSPNGDGPNVLKAADALKAPERVGRRVVVIGGGMIGCETAEYLCNSEYEVTCKGLDSDGSLLVQRRKKIKGDARKVSIISRSSEIAQDCEDFTRMLLIGRLKEKNIDVFTRAKVEKLTRHGLQFSNHMGKRKFIPCNTIVIARRPRPQYSLRRRLEKGGFKVYSVGDCIRMGGFPNAIHTGFHVGRLV